MGQSNLTTASISAGDPFSQATASSRPRRFAVIDRDGTINREREYISSPDQVELLPRAAEGLKLLQDLGIGMIVATNQSGVGRGYYGLEQVDAIHTRLRELLAEDRVELRGIYVCPHAPEEGCNCRKPRTGLIEQAADELGFSPRECFVIGDKPSDVELGKAIGATTILVRTGYGAATELGNTVSPDFVADDLFEAAEMIGGMLESIRDIQKLGTTR
jgi:D-glycero-D-manno-heptose 1,7-bisphosphate phosphatase